MTTPEGTSRRSPELWFGVFAGIAIPTLLTKLTALLLSNFPGEPSDMPQLVARSMLVLIIGTQVALAIAGFTLRQRHLWAVGLLAGSLLLLLPGGPQPLLQSFVEGATPMSTRLGLWTAGALPGLIVLGAAASVIYRVRFGDYVAMALNVAFGLYALDLALIA